MIDQNHFHKCTDICLHSFPALWISVNLSLEQLLEMNHLCLPICSRLKFCSLGCCWPIHLSHTRTWLLPFDFCSEMQVKSLASLLVNLLTKKIPNYELWPFIQIEICVKFLHGKRAELNSRLHFSACSLDNRLPDKIAPVRWKKNLTQKLHLVTAYLFQFIVPQPYNRMSHTVPRENILSKFDTDTKARVMLVLFWPPEWYFILICLKWIRQICQILLKDVLFTPST